MITQGIADAADYFNPESENRREQERLQTDLMKIELEKQRSGVNTGDSIKNPVSPMRDVKVSSTMTPENTPALRLKRLRCAK